MKKITKFCLLFVVLFGMFLCVGCSKVSQKTVDEINEAAKAKDPMTWTEVYEKLGPDYLGLSVGDSSKVTGVVWWYAGCKTQEEVDAKLEAGKSVNYVEVTFLAGKAQSAKFGTATPDEK